MTAQMPNIFQYRGQQYSIAGISGTGFFNPQEHNLKPIGTCSACWDGYICSYTLQDQRLVLSELRIELNEPAPELFGIQPVPTSEPSFWSAIYEGLQQPIPYTGGLLIARGFIRELYVHMGHHPAWKYTEVHELIFDNGKLLQETDRSAQIAEVRRNIDESSFSPGTGATKVGISEWIEQCFSQEYRGMF